MEAPPRRPPPARSDKPRPSSSPTRLPFLLAAAQVGSPARSVCRWSGVAVAAGLLCLCKSSLFSQVRAPPERRHEQEGQVEHGIFSLVQPFFLLGCKPILRFVVGLDKFFCHRCKSTFDS
ncbi:hypothetical protein TRIUR3_21675 [Triticum urartu]|uniref:Uncharacterized protein n=1 Tax=Triticum urartu TaxID=4572 RepID=M8AH94_TRIUA|nr:hypothetical protein TRIUR3_21675 [Triticum urartu]